MPRFVPILCLLVTLVAVDRGYARAQGGPAEPTVVSVLTMAKDEAEQAPTEQARIGRRMRVAWSIENTKQEAAFGSYVSDASAAWQVLRRQRDPNFQRFEKNRELHAQAKQAFLSGDPERSKELLRRCETVTSLYDCWREKMFDYRFFLWEIEIGDLPTAHRRLNTMSRDNGNFRIGAAAEMADAYLAAGRRQEAVDLLVPLQAASSGDKQSLATALWKVGATEPGRAMFREAVAAELAAADADDKKSLPVDLARIQLVIGDREGALETLAGIRALAAPIEYDPQALTGSNPRSTTITVRGNRWRDARDKMAGVLALAGLDAEAAALLYEPAANQVVVMQRILRGQAARGDFEAAFLSFERLRHDRLTGPERPLTIMPDPALPGSYEIRTRTLDDNSALWSLQKATLALANLAAHQGRADAMEKAFSLFREINFKINRDAEWIEILKEHARAGQAASALSLARRLDSPSARVAALAAVAEGMAGLRSVYAYNPLLPQG